MIITQLDRDAFFGEIAMRKGIDYVMADAVAAMIHESAPHIITRFDQMGEEYYKYNGEDLSGKSIVIWRTGGFGDLLFVSSLIHHLKMMYPTSRINVATSKRFHDVWEGNPDISKLGSPGILPIPLKFLQQHDYQLKFEGTIENDTDPNQLPAVQRFAQEACVTLTEQEQLPYYPGAFNAFTTARNKLRNSGLEVRPLEFGVIQFKSSSIVRDYRYTRMIELADRLATKYDMPILLMGNDFYHETIQSAAAAYEETLRGREINPKAVDITPSNMRFLYSAALISRAKFVVTVDSALVHVAAATNTPSVSLYGPFPGQIRTKLYPRNITLEKPGTCPPFPNGCLQHTQAGDKNVLPIKTHCKDNITHCKMMDAISVSEVMDAVQEAIDKWGHEDWTDRERIYKERASYVPEGAKVDNERIQKEAKQPRSQRLDKKPKRNRNRSSKKNRKRK